MTSSTSEPRTRSWFDRDPDRWTQELQALRATGWTFRAQRRDGRASAVVTIPVRDGVSARIRVRFHPLHPYFPPAFTALDDTWEHSRHYNPGNRSLCLLHEEDWDLSTTIGALMATQLPKVIAADAGDVNSLESARVTQDDDHPTHAGSTTGEKTIDGQTENQEWQRGRASARIGHGRGSTPSGSVSSTRPGAPLGSSRVAEETLRGPEWRVPTPVSTSISGVGPALLVHPQPIPVGVDQGVLDVRFSIQGSRLSVGVIAAVHGTGFTHRTDLPARQLEAFPILAAGRWARDPHYRPGESPSATWQRLSQRLLPLTVERATSSTPDAGTPGTRGGAGGAGGAGLAGPSGPSGRVGAGATDAPPVRDHRAPFPDLRPEEVEVIGVLVPDELTYRGRGESWVFLLRIGTSQGQGQGEAVVVSRPACHLSRDLLGQRTPELLGLADTTVVVVGLGAVGMPVAQDLAMTGIGRLVCIDPDVADPLTGSRQDTATLLSAGSPKAWVAAAQIRRHAPYCHVEAFAGGVQQAWEQAPRRAGKQFRDQVAAVRSALFSADLVIDATATPPVTRFLAELRHRVGRGFLHVSATAGAYGGVVSYHPGDNAAACWCCIEHSRADRSLPVPAADPTGWVAPVRCSQPTFIGARANLHLIALHASRVALAHLTPPSPTRGARPPGTTAQYDTATMVAPTGAPIPIRWTSNSPPAHPSCPFHHVHPSTAPASERHVESGDRRARPVRAESGAAA